jgi:hypothetical protein
LNGSYFLNKHGDVESRTSLALQEMFEAHQPSAWYFGHFHINREFLIGETKFRCSAELAISQVSEVFSRQKEFDEESRAQNTANFVTFRCTDWNRPLVVRPT